MTQVRYEDPGYDPLQTVAAYRYDALGRRIEYIDHNNAVTTRYYYDGQNVIAEYDESDEIQRSYVHGMQYIDERAVMRDHQVDAKAGDDQMGKDYYYLLQELYTVAGLADCRGWLAEMYSYQAYGDAQIWLWPEGDINRDGTTEYLDRGMVTAGRGKALDPLLDANLDGVVTYTDNYSMYWPDMNQTAMETRTANVGNPYMFTGRTTDTVHSAYRFGYPSTYVSVYRRLQDNRNRTYDAKHGRWLQRDPAGYVDGMNLYEYVLSNPSGHLDPSGYWAEFEGHSFDECYPKLLEWAARGAKKRDEMGIPSDFIMVFPNPMKTRYKIGYADRFEWRKKHEMIGGKTYGPVLLGMDAFPDIDEAWLSAPPRQWVAQNPGRFGTDVVNAPQAWAFAEYETRLAAFVDHRVCKFLGERPIYSRSGELVGTRDVDWHVSKPGYPKLFEDKSPISKGPFWGTQVFDTTGSIIEGSSTNIGEAVNSFRDAERQMETSLNNCVRCKLVTGIAAGKKFPEEQWPELDMSTIPDFITGVTGGP